MDGLGERLRLGEVGGRGLAPQHVGDRRVRRRPGDRRVDPLVDPVEALVGPLAGRERPVDLVDVGGEQRGGERVGAREEHGRHVEDVGGQPRRDQGPQELRGRDQDLAAEVPTLLLGRELVLEVDASRARLDHRAHHLEGVERPAEAGLRVGHDRRQEVVVAALAPRDLVGTAQRVVDALDDRGDRVRRVERLVRVGVAGQVRVGRHLPPREVDRLQARLRALHGLVAGQASQRGDVVARGDQPPELGRRLPRQGVVLADAAPQPDDLLGRVRADHTGPTRVGVPASLEVGGFGGDLLLDGAHRVPFGGGDGGSGDGTTLPQEGRRRRAAHRAAAGAATRLRIL